MYVHYDLIYTNYYYMYVKVLQELITRKQSTQLPISTELEKTIRQASVMVIANGSVFCLFSVAVSISLSINALCLVFDVLEDNHCAIVRGICCAFISVNAFVNQAIISLLISGTVKPS